MRENFLSFAPTRQRHVGTSPNANYDPELWIDGFAFLSRMGQQDIQTDLFYDYRTNVASHLAWQAGLAPQGQPVLQVVWGRYHPSFQVRAAEAYRRDVLGAEVYVLDAGHFALDEQPDVIGDLTRRFCSVARLHTDG